MPAVFPEKLMMSTYILRRILCKTAMTSMETPLSPQAGGFGTCISSSMLQSSGCRVNDIPKPIRNKSELAVIATGWVECSSHGRSR